AAPRTAAATARLEAGALVFLRARDEVAAARGGRTVLLALEVAADRIVGDVDAAGVVECLQVAVDRVAGHHEVRLVGIELDVAADLDRVDHADRATEIVELDVPPDATAADVDRDAAFGLDAAVDLRAAGHQRAAGVHEYIADYGRALEQAFAGDQHVAVDGDLARSGRAGDIVGACRAAQRVAGEQHAEEQRDLTQHARGLLGFRVGRPRARGLMHS